MEIQKVQKLLKYLGLYSGKIDGIIGKQTLGAIEGLLLKNFSVLPKNYYEFPFKIKIVLCSQVILKNLGFYSGEIDGNFGSLSIYAYKNWEKQANYTEEHSLEEIYGIAGRKQCFSGKVVLPFKMKLSWDFSKEIDTFSCHEKVANVLNKIFQEISKAYTAEEIENNGFNIFGGCYNYRLMKGSNKLSMHAYGIAVDIDPERNEFKWKKDKSHLAKKECEKFWEIWESNGWYSLGRKRDFDWMHVQAVKL